MCMSPGASPSSLLLPHAACLSFPLVTVPGMLGWVEPASRLFLCLAQDNPGFWGGVSAQAHSTVIPPAIPAGLDLPKAGGDPIQHGSGCRARSSRTQAPARPGAARG